MTHRLLRGLSRKQAIRDRVARALGVLKAFNVTAPGGFQLNIDVSAITGSADSGDIEDDLTELLVEVGEAARAGGKGVVYLVDEMQNLEPVAMGALCMAFHKLAQQTAAGRARRRRAPAAPGPAPRRRSRTPSGSSSTSRSARSPTRRRARRS